MATDFGTDISLYPDLDASFSTVTGFTLIGQDLARRLETPLGGLFYDSNYGYDVREMVNDASTQANVLKRQSGIERECKKDERILNARATVTFSPATQTAAVKILIDTALGPFTMILAVTQLTVALLKVG